MSSTEPPTRMHKALLCDLKGVARLLASDVSAVLRELDAGRLPAPMLVCGEMRWRIAEIREWVAAGCPDRATWDRRTTRPRALPAKRKPARQAPTGPPQHDNFKIPKPGTSVFAWTKQMERVFEIPLVDGMGRDGEAQGWGRTFKDWSESQVNTICLGVIAFIRELPTYAGQFEQLFPGESPGPPW